jgi:ribosomal protein S18 acetylase RimI-like enzyme
MPNKLTKETILKLIESELKEQESSGFDIKDFCCYFSKEDGRNMVLYHGPKMLGVFQFLFSFKTDIVNKEEVAKQLIQDAGVVGFIALDRPRPGGKCMGSYEVMLSAVHPKYQGQKIGKLLYMLTMMEIYPSPLMSDRNDVSEKARWIWLSMDKNSEIEKTPSDEGGYMGEFDDIKDPETSPEDDDCKLQDDSYLNRGYIYKGSGQNLKIKSLLTLNHKKYIKSVIDVNDNEDRTYLTQQWIESAINEATDKLFYLAYQGK